MKRAWLAFLLAIACPALCRAGLSPHDLQQVKLDPAPGTVLPLATPFVSAETGAAITAGQALGGKPALLVLVNYTCRFICGSTLSIAAAGLSETRLAPGSDFQFVVIGIDARDGREAALAMKTERLGPYPALLSKARFLTGSAAAIGKLTDALHYHAVYDTAIGQFAHPTGAVAITPDGRVSRVISGLALNGATLRAALQEAQQERFASFTSGIQLLCYALDPLHGPHTATIRFILMGAGGVTLAGMAGFANLLRQRTKARRAP